MISAKTRRIVAAAIAAGALTIGAAACSDDDKDKAADTASSVINEATDTATTDTAAPTESPATESTDTSGSAAAGSIPGPNGSDITVDPAIAAKYQELGGADGALGAATGEQETVGDGFSVAFKNGTIFSSPETGAHVVQGEILRVYTEQGGAAGKYGFPTADEATTDGGWISTFSGGDILWTHTSGTWAETLKPKA